VTARGRHPRASGRVLGRSPAARRLPVRPAGHQLVHRRVEQPGELHFALWAGYFLGGLRRGEARAARCYDLDLQAPTIRVERTWDDVEGELDGGKSDAAERTVPLVGAAPALLRAHLLATGRRGLDLLFGETATEPFEPSTVRRRALEAWGWKEVPNPKPDGPARVWVKARPDALRPIAPHECRHTYASLLIAAGGHALQIKTFLGHSSIKVTYDTYGHLFPASRDETIRRVNAYLAAQEAAHGPLKAVD
jgi:integrase